MAFINEKDDNGNLRTIDAEKEIVLCKRGFDYTQNEYDFTMSVDGEDFHFKANLLTDIDANINKQRVCWIINEISNLPPIKRKQDHILSIIVDALKSYALLGNGRVTSKVEVQFLNI